MRLDRHANYWYTLGNDNDDPEDGTPRENSNVGDEKDRFQLHTKQATIVIIQSVMGNGP